MYIFPYKSIRKHFWPCRKKGQGHHLNKLCWAQIPNAVYQAPRSMALWFWKRKFLKGFYHIRVWRPPWSCDPDPLNKVLSCHPTEAPYEIWLWLAQWFLTRRCLKMVDNEGRTDNWACLYYISSAMNLMAQFSTSLFNRFQQAFKITLQWTVLQRVWDIIVKLPTVT